MTSQKYRDYLKSREWAQIRNDLYVLRGRKCERCGNNKKLQVHHKTYKNIFKEEPSDLEILCGGCHEKEHKKIKKKRKKNLVAKGKRKKRMYYGFEMTRKQKRIQKRWNILRAKGIIK